MSKQLAVLVLSFCFVFFACKKVEEEPPTEEPIVNAYFPLNTGNYWVYDFKNYLPDGTSTGNTFVDSLVVVGDTLIEQNTYWVLETDRPSQNATWFLRDSAGYVLNKNGSTILPPDPRNEYYNAHHGFMPDGDTIYYYFDRFPSTQIIQTIAGDKLCMQQLATHTSFPNFGGQTIVDSSYYAAFGPVQRSYAFLSGSKMIGTLVDHHVE